MSAADPDLLVVGGGPAGMSAAIAAAERGLSCTLIDEGFELGGQIYRQPLRPAMAPRPHPRGAGLRRRLAELGTRIQVRSGAVAWGVFEGRKVAIGEGDSSRLLEPRQIVLAPGAYEYVPPFPGWTLPGVMTPGAAQVLVKTMGIAPGRRVILSGTGPFLLAVACQMVKAGVEVLGVLEASPRLPWLLLPLAGWRTPGILLEGLSYLATLARAGVPVRHGRTILRAEGDGCLRRVTHAPVDDGWVPDRSRAVTEEVDTLLVGFGFVPRCGLAQMAGCRLGHDGPRGGWVPLRSGDLETTVPGVFAAGDGAGVAGALVAALEGRLAGLAAARRLGALDAANFAAARRPLDRRLARLWPLRRALDRICEIRPGLGALVEDDTVVCRCEELTWRETRAAIEAGNTGYRSLKVACRLGMGACQGRSCWPAVSRLLARHTGQALESLGPTSARPPERPISLGALAACIERSPR